MLGAVILLSAAATVGTERSLDVWMVPHAHCDVGWLMSVDGYFHARRWDGSENSQSVSNILTEVTKALSADETLRFIWSETKWIEMWWPQQTPAMQAAFKRIVKRGQLEFVGAGWSQNDEVTTAYYDVIDNQVTGHEFLRRTGLLDECPQPGRCIRFGWQIDMFAGFSGATPNLWAMAGYDGMFLRWEGTDAQNRSFMANQGYEWIWESSGSLAPNRSRIFTHSLMHNYGDLMGLHNKTRPYVGYDWSDNHLGHEDSPASHKRFGAWSGAVNASNVEDFAWTLLNFLQLRASVYQGPIMGAWGSDYRFMNASINYMNMKKIHREINDNPAKYNNASIRFATLAEYADHLHSLKIRFPVHRWPEDFEHGWPHLIGVPNDGPDPPNGTNANASDLQYQTGAPVSRAAFKQRAREVSAVHHAAEVAHAVAVVGRHMNPIAAELFPAWDALGIVQHHDAMPGTMSTKGAYTSWGDTPPFASGDPVNRGAVACGEGSRYHDTDCLVLADYFMRLSAGYNASTRVLAKSLGALGGQPAALYSAEQDGTQRRFTVFNSLGWPRSAVVQVTLPQALRVPHGKPAAQVHGTDGRPLVAQMSEDGASLHFLAKALPAAGALTFTMSAASGATSSTRWPRVTAEAPAQPLKNGMLQLAFAADGSLASISRRRDAVTVKAAQHYFSYVTAQGGPYMLVENASAIALPPPSSVRTVTGPVFTEVVQTFRGWGSASLTQPGPTELTQTTRLTAGDSDVVEVSHGIPVIPMEHELISRLHTDLASDTVWTDDTGLEMYPRKLDPDLPISGNYKSLVGSAMLKAGKRALSVLTRHTMGVAVLAESQLEYMMLRRISGTDDQGPWPLNETTPITVHTALLAGSANTVTNLRLIRALEHENPPVAMYTSGSGSSSGSAAEAQIPALGKLPTGMHMLSFYIRHPRPESTAEGSVATEVVIQLQNVIEHSAPIMLAGGIASLLPGVSLSGCTEMTLTLQQKLAENKRMSWLALDGTTSGAAPAAADDCGAPVAVGALDIRSFVATAPRVLTDDEATAHLQFHEPTIVTGHINVTRFKESQGREVQMMDPGLGIPCVFFGLEWPYTKSIWSALQYFSKDAYIGPHGDSEPPMPNPPPRGGAGSGAQGLFEDVSPFPLSSDGGESWKEPGAADLPMPLFQAMHPNGSPNTLVAQENPCACAGDSCSLQSNLKRKSSAWGGCLPVSAGGTVPPLPWWNFSSALALSYNKEANGTISATRGTRRSLFYGLPHDRPAWNKCTTPRKLYPLPLGATGPFPDAELQADAAPIRLHDGSLVMNVALCLYDRPLPWKMACVCPASGPAASQCWTGLFDGAVVVGHGTCAAINGTWTALSAQTQVVFRSVDDGFTYKYQGVLANPADFANRSDPMFTVAGTTSELSIVELADSRTLSAIWRPDGDCGCGMTDMAGECAKYNYYYQSFSTDLGVTWTKAVMMQPMGCVKPRLLALGAWDGFRTTGRKGPIVLSGGRLCVENVTDIYLWFNADGMAGFNPTQPDTFNASAWVKHSISFEHNRLWGGTAAYKFDAQINNSLVFATQSYTTLLQTAPLEFVVSYNKYFHPVDGAPGCTHDKPAHGVCSTAFAMKVSVVQGV